MSLDALRDILGHMSLVDQVSSPAGRIAQAHSNWCLLRGRRKTSQ